MKLIHASDIHLGSKIDSTFPKEKAKQRQLEIRNTFRKMVEYADEKGVEVILLSGDVFDSDRPLKKDKDFFYSIINSHPHIDFIYLKGNHDQQIEEQTSVNLKCFSSVWQSYRYGKIVISGIEMTPENCTSFYSTLSLQKEDRNIVLLHGQVSDTMGMDRIYLRRLRNKQIDYLALGHVHKHQEGKLDDRGKYAYSGCLEGRGFDEIGEHGFILLAVEDEIKTEFIPFQERLIVEEKVDISAASDAYSAAQLVKKIPFVKEWIYRIVLVGETETDDETLAEDVLKYLSDQCFFLSVKDQTKRKINTAVYQKDLSLKGEFVRTVEADLTLSDEEKNKIIRLGLKALANEEVDL